MRRTNALPAPAAAIRTLPALIFAPLLVLLCASSARAVPITVTGGHIGTPQGLGNFSATLTAPGFYYTASDVSAPDPQLCGLCAPGQTFPGVIQVRLPEGGFPPVVLSYGGVTYGTGNGGVTPSLVITLPSFTIPNGGTVVSPFTLSGTLTARPLNGSPITFDVTGSGTVTLNFLCPNQFGGCTLGAVAFTFSDPAAVPEPATMTLLATGLIGAAAGARRRRRRGER